MLLNELPADGGEALAGSCLLMTSSSEDSRSCCYFSGLTIHISVQPCRTARQGEKTFYCKQLHSVITRKDTPYAHFTLA